MIYFKSKRIIKVLKSKEAFDEASAINMQELNSRELLIRRKLISQGIIHETEVDKYYLNQSAVAVFENNRKYFKMIIFILALLIILAFILGAIN